MDDDFIIWVFGLFSIFVIFTVIGGSIFYGRGYTEIVNTAVLEDACKAIYGENFTWVDYEWGFESNLVCELAPPKPEEVVIPTKLNGYRIYNGTLGEDIK